MAFYKLPLAALLACAEILTGCATNTMTGRSQIVLVSEAVAAQRSAGFYNSMVHDWSKQRKVVEGQAINTRINRITNRLIQQAVLYSPASAQWDWKVSVIDDDQNVNAFCMPGGLMAMYTGLVKQLGATDDEIAQVMGHEIGHALAGHGAEKMSVQLASSVGVLAVSAAATKNSREFQASNAVLSVAALSFINLPNSRVVEVEADRIGIELAARAGYHPAAAVTLWQKMASVDKSKNKAEFFSTHPAPERRQENLLALGEPMMALYQSAGTKGPAYDWLHGNKNSRPAVAATGISFYR